MSAQQSLFSVQVKSYDLLFVSVLEASRPCVYRAKLEYVYSCRHGIERESLGSEFEFHCGPMSWGNTAMQVGERGLLFVRKRSGIFNEYPWHGHMVLEKIDDELYCSVHCPELWLRNDLPVVVKAASRQHPSKRNHSLVRFDVLEAYLNALIADVERDNDK